MAQHRGTPALIACGAGGSLSAAPLPMRRLFAPLFALFVACAVPAAAQDSLGAQADPTGNPATADPMAAGRAAALRGDDAEALAHFLRVLAKDPRDLEALTGAGRAALDLDDPDSAIAFYARAEEVAPRNGRVKAGLGSAMVAQRNPRAALRFFGDAVELGVPEADIAADRGLAYDLRGDPKRAQADYRTALAARDDAETVRRLALSQAISGARDQALATLDPLLRRQDIPAWRARAFVFAITGDPAEASRAAAMVMPRTQAEALGPYLNRIATLKAAQQAAAVHFVYLPSGSTEKAPVVVAATAPPVLAPAPEPTRPSRRKRRTEAVVATGITGNAEIDRFALTATPPPTPPAPAPKPVVTAAAPLPAPEPTRAKATRKANPKPAATEAEQPEKVAKAEPKPKAKPPATPKPEANPERHWVQVAGGANLAGFPRVWAGLKKAHATLLARQSPWTNHYRFTNRLLVGPFDSEDEAQAFVNQAAKDDLPAFSVTTPKGDKVEKLAAK